MNPKSYAARAQARPDLILDTSPTLPTSYSQASPFSEEEPCSPPERPYTSDGQQARKGSVPDRSPLQKLEVTLGDISKEEKRARVEEAEQIARQNSGANGDVPLEGSRGSSLRSNGDRGIIRKPLPADSFVAQKAHGSRGIQQVRMGRKSSVRQGGVLFPHQDTTPSRDRRFGHDAALTGGAAAAAVVVYRPGMPLQHGRLSPTSEVSSGFRETDGISRQEPQSRTQTTPVLTNRGMGEILNKRLQSDAPVLPAAGRRENQPLGSQSQFAAVNQDQGAEEKRRLRFSGLVHRDQPPDRRYQAPKPLQEWRTASTATLLAEDLDLDSVQSQAWWERNSNQKAKNQRRSSPGTPSISDYLDGDVPQTRFQPPLLLKCGPLLRYKGIGHASSTGPNGRTGKFWRGSVMIVTEDATSSNEAPPTLRLFKQPMETLSPQLDQANNATGAQVYSAMHDDPIAGSPKCAPTGQTVFAKHVKHLQQRVDLSMKEGDAGLFESNPSTQDFQTILARLARRDGEKVGRHKEVKGHRLHMERGVTFWRFNIEVQLGSEETRVAYRINKGPPIGFWVPAENQAMNVMFHSCNGFSSSVDSDLFSGPDPLWRDVLGAHQKRPFHVMVGGGDQIYNDIVMNESRSFGEWLSMRNPVEKHHAHFTEEMQDELEHFYLTRYAMWFSQGLFGLANSQIPMVNVWDDHDIIDVSVARVLFSTA